MGASLKDTGGCAGGQMCRNVGMRIYHTAYRQERERYTVNNGRTTAKTTGNIKNFQSATPQYTPNRFAPVTRHITRCVCICVRGALLKATDRTVATATVNKTRNVRIIVRVGSIGLPTAVVERNKYYILSVCVCSLRYPPRNAHVPYCHLLSCPALQYFPTLSHKQHDFRNKVIEHKMCVLIFCTILSAIFLILTTIKPQIIINAHSCSGKVADIIGQIFMNLEFSERFSKKIQNIKFDENLSSGRPAVPRKQTEERRDATRLMVFFRNFLKAPKI